MVPSWRRRSTRVVPTARRAVTGVACCMVAALVTSAPAAAWAPPGRGAPALPAPAPNDLGYGLQWGLAAIGAPAAWDAGLSGAGVTIAIVDSGADLDHEDLQGQVVANVSCIGSGGSAAGCTGSGQDDDGHGTHVAGIAAANTNNGAGIASVAPGARLMIVRVLEHTCTSGLLGGERCSASGSADDVIAGIRWAVANGADVVNLSVGSSLQGVLGPAFAQAIREAWAAGVVPVVAAGNDQLLGSGFGGEPALVVAAAAADGGAASYSTGVGQAQWGLTAPGGEAESDPGQCASGGHPEGILSTYLSEEPGRHEYACLAGTSMAAPHVAGAIALLLGAGLAPQEAVDRLLGTATDLGARGRDATFGHGLLNLAAAVEGLARAPAPTEPATSQPPATEPATTQPPATEPPTTAAPASTAPTSTPTAEDPSFDPGQAAQLTPAQGRVDSDDLPGLPVAIAVLMVALTGCSTSWWAFRHASWARRTPG